MNEEKNQKILAVVLVIAVICLGVYKLFFTKKTKNTIDTTIKVVTSINDFYTVSSCVDNFFIYVNSLNTENIMILLSEEYKNKNNITSSNLYNYVEKFDKYYSFIPKKMYVQKVSKGIEKYYVYGQKEVVALDDFKTGDDYYVIVILDRTNLTFAIEPYDGESFSKLEV